MILVLCSPGHVATAVSEALEGLDEDVRRADPTSELFTEAIGCNVILYVPEPRLLDARGVAMANAARTRDVVRVAYARGARHVVLVEPVGSATVLPAGDERCRKRDGVDTTTVRSAALIDELADAMNLHTAGSLWLPRGRLVELTSRAALARSIRFALLVRELRGGVVHVPSEQMEVAEAMRRAAAIAGASVNIRASAPALARAVRKLRSWLGVGAAEVDALCERLGASATAARA